MIIVTGANGHLGRAIVEGLLTYLPADQIVASVATLLRQQRSPNEGCMFAQGLLRSKGVDGGLRRSNTSTGDLR